MTWGHCHVADDCWLGRRRSTDGGAVLVDRGWVPRDQVDQVSQPVGELCVDGVLRCGETAIRLRR